MSDNVLSRFKQAEEAPKPTETGRKLKIGIIGAGGISWCHFNNYVKMNDVEIVAIADLIPERAIESKEQFGLTNARIYPSHKELLDNEELDGVSICTYNCQHAEPTIYALEKGVSVLLEKPFTVTLDEAIEVMRAEKRTGKFVSVGFQPRFNPNMQTVTKIVRSGVLGDVYYVQTGGGRRRGIPGGSFIEDRTAGIGALGDIGCYSLDMVMNALGHPKPLTVTGYVSDFFGKDPKYNGEDAGIFNVDDFGAGLIRLEGGVILDFRIAWAMHPDTPGDTVFFGKEGALRVPSTDCWNGSLNSAVTLYHDVCGEQTETKIPLKEEETSDFYLKIRSFLDAIKTGGPSPVPTSEIVYNQAIIDGIMKSARLGHEIEVEIPEI